MLIKIYILPIIVQSMETILKICKQLLIKVVQEIINSNQ